PFCLYFHTATVFTDLISSNAASRFRNETGSTVSWPCHRRLHPYVRVCSPVGFSSGHVAAPFSVRNSAWGR
ncbi:hypothetical protein VIGAN_08191500, partial [Vigna angularis var. angularis]